MTLKKISRLVRFSGIREVCQENIAVYVAADEIHNTQRQRKCNWAADSRDVVIRGRGFRIWKQNARIRSCFRVASLFRILLGDSLSELKVLLQGEPEG